MVSWARTHLTAVAAGLGAAAVIGVAAADFQGAETVAVSNVDGLATYRVYMHFHPPTDRLLAVGACPSDPFVFDAADLPLHNDGGLFKGLAVEDFAGFPLSGARDSWVTIGHDVFAGNDTEFSPGFLGSDGIFRVIEGAFLSDAAGGWFDGDITTPSTGASILVAQFTFPSEGFPYFMLEGCVTWLDESGVRFEAPFLTGWAFACCEEDLDGDDQVDFGDLLLLLSAWGPCAGSCAADFDEDGDVGPSDLVQLLSQWDTICCK